MFEGEYLNGEKNGKGKEFFYNGNLLFEGNYLHNKRHGKGQEYNKNGELIFEGEYLYNNKYNGKGYDEDGNKISSIRYGKGYVKKYDYYGNLEFSGEYLNGERNGKGKEYYDYMIIIIKEK